MRNKSYVPMELVDVEPVRTKKVTDDQRALLCRYASVDANTYKNAVKDIRANPEQQCFEQDPFVAAWNLNVDVKMMTVPARVLPMPEIAYTPEYTVTRSSVRNVGTWELRPTRFHTPTQFPSKWGIINLTSLHKKACQEFYNELEKVARQRGITCPPPEIYEEQNVEGYSADQIVGVLKDLMSTYEDVQFYLVILPPKNTKESKQAYRNLKKMVNK